MTQSTMPGFKLTGATRLYLIIGDPIAQVKSPGGMTAAFAASGRDAVLVPVQVAAEDLDDFLSVATRMKNLDGIVVTVPHKFACFRSCASTSERSGFLGAVNVMRRAPGGWHGEMVDGLGFVGAARAKGFDLQGKRALLIGAGGAGSAIGLELLEAGVSALSIHDSDAMRRDALVERLDARAKGRVIAGPPDPAGFDFVANATPAGMKPGDELPVAVSKLSPETFVGCAITAPAVSPLIEAARKIGCPTFVGSEMYAALQDKMMTFLMSVQRQA
jgi:shikimate dehydrogenase